jgi:hypothetical protein
MPQGYYTIEQWTPPGPDAESAWIPILHLPLGASLTAAETALEALGKPGFYRVVQTQRVIWAENEGGALRLRKSHAGSPESLDRMRAMFERCDGRYPVEEVRQARRDAKAKKARLNDA